MIKLNYDDLSEMRILMVKGGLAMAISNEEDSLVSRIISENSISKSSLTIRERELARKLVSRGVLISMLYENEIIYRFNDLEDVWRV